MAKFFALAFLCICAFAQAEINTRIVGGKPSDEAVFPYQVSLRANDSHRCGGSILSPTIILTAAHCVDGVDPSKLSIRAGSLNRFQGGVKVKVAKWIMHENYGNLLNDIAVVFLEQPLVYSKRIQPIELPTKPHVNPTPIILSGWGRIREAGDLPRYLQYVTLSTLPSEECLTLTERAGVICIYHPTTDVGSCNGDSGGPAMWDNKLIGVTSFKIGTCGSENPDGYTDVYYFLDWIKKNTGL